MVAMSEAGGDGKSVLGRGGRGGRFVGLEFGEGKHLKENIGFE